jgi:hypothetical protein
MGTKAAAEEKKNLILTIVSSILIFLPVAGEFAIELNLVSLGKIVALISAGGGATVTILDIVEHPKSTPMAILGALWAGRLRTPNHSQMLLGNVVVLA